MLIMKEYSFNIDIACKVGINAAVVYYNLSFWIDKNIANGKNFKDGKYWTYNSIKAFEKLFPFMSGRQIRTALEKLKDSGLIEEGSFNKESWDRTKWYSVCAMNPHLTKKSNGNDENVEPIPYRKPYNKPVYKQIEPENNSGSLFPEKNTNKLSLFRNSIYGDENGKLYFVEIFNKPDYLGVDINYYYHAVKDWSDSSNKKRTAKGWVATARNFMRSDKQKGKLKMTVEAQKNTKGITDNDTLDYLNNYE